MEDEMEEPLESPPDMEKDLDELGEGDDCEDDE